MVEVDVDVILIKRWLKLFALRVLCLGAHYIAVMDGLASMANYPTLKTKSDAIANMTGSTNMTTLQPLTTKPLVTVARPAKIVYCNMKATLNTKELDSALMNFNMSFFLLLGFYGIAALNFIVKTIVHLRLAICPIWQEPDAMGRVPPTTWDKVRDASYNLATFPCDMAIMSCIVGLFAVKHGAKGLGCWECYMTPTCKSKEDFEKILFMSGLACNLNFFLVLTIVFYKGFTTYFRATDPEKCDCHCEAPRCVTGCFVSLTITCIVMMPPFVIMMTKYFDLKEIELNIFGELMEKMMLVGIIIWAVVGIFVFIVVPCKMVLMRDDGGKK